MPAVPARFLVFVALTLTLALAGPTVSAATAAGPEGTAPAPAASAAEEPPVAPPAPAAEEPPAAPPAPEDLIAAARRGDLDEVRRLLAAGVPVDAADRYGTTALLAAAGRGHLELVRDLLERGADRDHRETFYGSSALEFALFSGHSEVARLLLASGADGRAGALEFAVREGDEALARAAVESGPIEASRLEALRARSADLQPAFRDLLARAESRPDPPPPEYSAADLAAFAGAFEGFDSDLRAVVAVAPGGLTVAVGDEKPRALTVLGERRFRSAAGDLEATFWGRSGMIEGLALRRGDEERPQTLRRSEVEPVGAAAFKPALREGADGEPTVNWPSFRGANAAGIGDGADAPTSWDLATGEGVLWQTELPGLGNSSPVVWGNRVFVTTAVAEGVKPTIQTGLTGAVESVEGEEVVHSWRVLAFDKTTGARLWETEIGRAVPLTQRHFKATQANSTPATDGKHLVVVFPTAGLACLDLAGKVRWKRDLGGLNAGFFFDPDVQWGYASSPILHGGRVILQVDVHEGAYLAAWDLGSGEQAWKTDREVAPSWSTPALLPGPEGDELVVNGSTIHAYDPRNGRELWSLGPNSELVIAAPVVGEGVVYVSAGYPPVRPIYAVKAGTRGDLEVDPRGDDPRLLWSQGIGGAYMPTPLLYRGLYYVVHHDGRLVAYDAANGNAIFKSRFSKGGVFTASPVAVNGKLYLGTEEGLLYVLAAGPEYKEIAVHEFGEPLMATPAVSEGVLFIRTPSKLIAIGEGEG